MHEVDGEPAKAADPLAPLGKAMYYHHSRTAFYNSFFFEYWDECFLKTFGLLCPFYAYDSTDYLLKLLNTKLERYVYSFTNRQ